MELGEIVENVNAELLPATSIDSYIKRWANRGQKKFLAEAERLGHTFSWTITSDLQLTTVIGQSDYVLNPYVDLGKLKTMTDRTNDRKIRVVSRQEFQEYYPDPTETTGSPEIAYLAGYSAVEQQPSSASTLSVVSDSGTDTAILKIRGLNSNGVLVGESITLNGTTPVSSTISYQQIQSRSFDGYTTGIVTITSNSGAVTNATIAPGQRQGIHPIIRFYPAPSAVDTLYYDAAIQFPDMVNDADMSMIPEKYHDALEEYCLYKGYRHKKNSEGAMLAMQEFQRIVATAVADDKDPRKDIQMKQYRATYTLGEPQFPGNFPKGY